MCSTFNFGRAYQLGRSHAVYEMSMLSYSPQLIFELSSKIEDRVG